LSAITPRPTQRLIPASPLYRLRPSPCRRLTTLTVLMLLVGAEIVMRRLKRNGAMVYYGVNL
jgi:hypothetical protein